MALPSLAEQKAIVRDAARRYGIDPRIEWGVYGAETDFGRNLSTSSAGAVGPFQFMPATASSLRIDPLDFRSAAYGAAKYLGQYKARGTAGMLAAYNAGPSGDPHNAETRAYIPRVLKLGQQLGGPIAPAKTALPVPGARASTSTASGEGLDSQRAYALGQFLRRANPFDIGPKTGTKPNGPLLAILPTAPPAASTTDTLDRAHAAVAKLAGGAIRRVSAPAAARGVATFEGARVAAWIAPALQWARQHGWTGTVTSGFRSYADQKRIYDSGVRPAAKPGTSNHEGADFPRGAVDVTNASQLAALLKRSPYASQLIWAGAADPVHFSHPHDGGY